MSTETTWIKNVDIYIETKIIERGSIIIRDGKIKQILTEGASPSDSVDTIVDGKGRNLIPGFIDGHIHGANGADVMDATEEALDTMAQVLPAEGTTSFLATTMTQSRANIDQALENIGMYANKPGYAEVIGVHLEGPFINIEKSGAQPVNHILKPNIEQFAEWQRLSGDKIKTITLAPECDEDHALIHYLAEKGVNISAGHTSAGFQEMQKAVEHGVSQVTHLANAMTGLHHRDVGVVGAAFLLEELRAELIADGIHISPEMIDIFYRNIGKERLMIITDALRAKCLQPGTYDLGGQSVTVTDQQATLENGTLAGSILKLRDGAKNVMRYTGAALQDVIEMTSVNPAKQIDVFDRKGSIEIGKDADVLLVDDELNIYRTYCRGVLSYSEGNEHANNGS
ncbi:N-acetylglucosamine-6-phosphate deacetylase [Radiobacillus kanasensis]|uniref:N-acetylglucosamine-6-phosphate deacetylase n=1 Tax=Radiobacillus kanasensis TaxID=2844358 RepID=UPI001E3DA508|nr:N-acetylglucosamine-6-phosphate deacetylase [Radiobacillus kanasensis]UFT98564.1 N-acetylglucosamine-6-phosphate deacetylase [Radiobacillus kanasensis]